jgi:hypothetical protein
VICSQKKNSMVSYNPARILGNLPVDREIKSSKTVIDGGEDYVGAESCRKGFMGLESVGSEVNGTVRNRFTSHGVRAI